MEETATKRSTGKILLSTGYLATNAQAKEETK
jgi:hypothetical protein